MRSERRKRASDEDLYRSCRQGGDCIPDVVKKYEHDTIADNILKWGSTAVYFGGLGIGTGGARPTQPQLGWQIPKQVPYRPLPEGTSASRPGTGWQIPREGTFQLPRPLRPVVSGGSGLETVLPGDFTVSNASDILIEAEPLGPNAPAVITPETVPDSTDTIGSSIITEHPDSVHVNIDVGAGENAAVLEIPPTESADRITTLTTRSGGTRSTFQLGTGSTILGETSETAHVFVNGSNIGGDTGESIEMHTFTGPHTSTPDSILRARPRGIGNPFSKRYYTQVEVNDTQFLLNPRGYVTEEYYDNPAFEDLDESFPIDSRPGRPYPRDPAYLDLGRLGRVTFTKSPQGTLGVSRIGSKFTITTRSGTSIGGQVHFRYPIDPILEEIELADLGTERSEVNDAVLETRDTSFINTLETGSRNALDTVSETELLLDSEPPLNLGHLTFANLHTVRTLPVGSGEAETSIFTVTDVESTIHVPSSTYDLTEPTLYTEESDESTQGTTDKGSKGSNKRKFIPLVELLPGIYVDEDYEPYLFVWHPHLYQVKKKRKTL